MSRGDAQENGEGAQRPRTTLSNAIRNHKRYRDFPSHLWPRTTRGRVIAVLFLGLLALAEWPLLPLANRIDPPLLGMPFLFGYLLLVYVAIIVVLVAAAWLEL